MSTTLWLLSSLHLNNAVSGGALAGFAAHHTLFKRGEWHLWAPRLVDLHLKVPVVLFLAQFLFNPTDIAQCFWSALRLTVGYLCASLVSMAIYRGYFHQLKDFRGPPPAKFTKLWHVYQTRDCRNHEFLEQVRQQYGDFVRTGPNEITVFHPEIHRLIDGPTNNCSKSSFYDLFRPDLSIITSRDKAAHDERRRLWFRGLGSKAMHKYEQRMPVYLDTLSSYLSRSYQQNTPVIANDAFFWFCWDVMGDTTFGRSFDMLANEQWHEAILMLKRALRILGIVIPAPWAIHVAVKYLSGRWVIRDWQAMKQVCYGIVQERIRVQEPQEDIFESLLGAARKNGLTERDTLFLNGDAVVGLVAGSDPPASTLVQLFSHLARDEELQSKLLTELASCDIRDANSLKSCDYLTGLINETLRLYPALMTGGMRDTGPEGLMVGDTFIPGGTTIVAPRFSISRLESCFVQPNDFTPERWTTRPELVTNSKPFNPFGIGSRSCVGKNIVWSQLRLVTANLVSRFRVQLAPGETGTRAFDELKDYLAPCPGRLELVFEPRSR